MPHLRKLTALILALLCLLLTGCTAPSQGNAESATTDATAAPAATDGALPDLNLPITLEAYQQAYDAVINGVTTGNTVKWSASPLEDSEAWIATVNDAFVSVMLLPADGQVSELAVLLQADLSENTLMTFLSMGGYAGAALLVDEDTTAEQACDAFMAELLTVFLAIQNGEIPENIYNLPGMINITPLEDGTYQYYFVLRLDPAAAE